MSRTWFTADLHLGHQHIIRHCGRPYRGLTQMNADLVRRWNHTVAADDTVWVLGDVGAAAALPLVRLLRGTKHLVSGNHDHCWPGNGPLAEASRWMYLAAGFATIRTAAEVTLGGERVALSHFPYEGDSHGDDRFIAWRPRDDGRWIVHGHVHTAWHQRGRMINAGVDVWDYAPVAAETLVELMRAETEPVGIRRRRGAGANSPLAGTSRAAGAAGRRVASRPPVEPAGRGRRGPRRG